MFLYKKLTGIRGVVPISFFVRQVIGMANPSIYLEVDASDLNRELERLKSVMTRETFNKAMYGIFQRTGSHVRTILRKDLPVKYNIKSAEVGKAVKNGKVSFGGLGVGCSIPVVAARRHIGGGHGYTARGYRRGWAALRSGPYPIKVHVYSDSWGTLPSHLSSYGGQPGFRNIPSKLNGIAFTRRGKARLPIEKVMGIAIPQMPMNRSEPDVQADIKRYLEGRIQARFVALIGGH